MRGAIFAFYTFLKDEGLREDNAALKLLAVQVAKGQLRPFSREQMHAMRAGGSYRKTQAMILLGYYQGFRVSSIARVHGDDIDRMSNLIRTIGKGGKDRRLPLHPVIAKLADTMARHEWWFPAKKDPSTHVKPSSVTNLIAKAKIRAGILDPQLTPHSLRHVFGTDLVEADVDIQIVQKLMMHESLSTIQIYTGVSERRKQAGIVTLPPRPIPQHSGRSAESRAVRPVHARNSRQGPKEFCCV